MPDDEGKTCSALIYKVPAGARVQCFDRENNLVSATTTAEDPHLIRVPQGIDYVMNIRHPNFWNLDLMGLDFNRDGQSIYVAMEVKR